MAAADHGIVESVSDANNEAVVRVMPACYLRNYSRTAANLAANAYDALFIRQPEQ